MSEAPTQKPAVPEPTCDFATEAAAAELVKILDAYMADLQAGKAPSKAELLARHPQLASQLEACLAGLEFIHGTETATPGRQQRLGDFRIIREVGRGGMGAVFEAEQISLRRRVALKILRFASVSDPDAIERFQREAETIGALHHTNIVPIFAIGTERGISYYAMQFIEGQSLAQVLAENKQPLPADRVAEWGLQAADALAHAHERGVIHRDVKPSNLILDKQKRLWLTDFGLARRLDDVTLSMTGAILGTPRYMSPEQATATTKRVDHRTDLFSLGATLYELLTGQPAFSGDSPHQVIQHILTSEPKPIREHVKSAPRDLETIVMKCLAKEPFDRYAAASDLASDLRAFLDGRPIRARRASFIELAGRWIKSQQRSFQLAAAAVAITLVLTIGGLLGWSSYDAWRQGSVKLSTNMPPLVAEILNERDEILRTETLPMQNAASLPAGDYRLRVNGEATLSETFDLILTRGAEQGLSVDLQDQMLWTPRAIDRSYNLVDFGDELALVHLTSDGIGLHKRQHPLHQWSIKLESLAQAKPEQAAGLIWPWNSNSAQYSGYGPYDSRPWIAPQASDLNGDGTGDLLIAARHQAWLLALSGTNGQVLWFAPRGEDVTTKVPNAFPGFTQQTLSGVLGTPLTYDCNADGTPDVIATLGDLVEHTKQPGASQQYHIKCWVEAVSGKTGDTLWSYDLPHEWFAMPQGEEVPYDLRWFIAGVGGSTGSGGSFMNTGRHRIRDLGRIERIGGHAYRPAGVELITLDGEQRLAIVAGKLVVSLNPKNGQGGEPQELISRPAQPCRWGDLDGDGAADMVCVVIDPATAAGGAKKPSTKVIAWSLQKEKQLWEKSFGVTPPQQPGWSIDTPTWPLVSDLTGDGRCEVVLPSDGSQQMGRIGLDETPWGYISALDGAAGNELWSRRLVTMDQQVNHFVDGPDIDADGSRELYVATLEGADHRLHIDVLAGRTGKTIWHAYQQSPPNSNSSVEYYLLPLQWWNSGRDGWPQLVAQIGDINNNQTTHLWTFSAASGRIIHAATSITDVRPADIDRDGVEDLVVFNAKSTQARDLGGQLHCIRGVAREHWQRLGGVGAPAADFDGDGVRDLLAGMTAISGATNEVLWTAHSESGRDLQFQPAECDLNGDGIEDLLAWYQLSSYYQAKSPFSAVSGKTGQPLWVAAETTARMLHTVLSAEAHDLDGDGQREVLWLAMLDHGYPTRNSFSSNESQLWLFVTSGQTGKLRWSQSLSPAYAGGGGAFNQVLINNVTLSPGLGDGDGDGVLDILVPELLPDTRSIAMRALSGKDGTTLWKRPWTADPNQQPNLANWIPPTAIDLDGDGQTEFVLLDVQTVDDAGQPMQGAYCTVAVEGKDGKQRWSTPSGMRVGYWQPPVGYRKGDLLRPRVLRSKAGYRIGMMFPPHNTATKFVVLEANGSVLSSHEAKSLSSTSALWPCDIDGDEVDDTVFLSGELLCVARADKMQEPLWTKRIGSAGQQRIMDVLFKDAAPPVIVVARDATDNTVQGISAASGKTVWSCPGPIPRDPKDGTYHMLSHVALLDDGKAMPPRVYYAYNQVSRVRQAAGSPESHPSIALTSEPDRRWQRDLPWARNVHSWGSEIQFIGWSLAFSTFLVVLPGGYLGFLIWKRRFTLIALLLLPVVAGLSLTFALMKPPIPDNDFANVLARLYIGLFLAPAVIGIAMVVWWSIRGRWRPIVSWLLVSLVVSAIMMTTILMTDYPLLPEQNYDWSHWYMIWLPAAFVTSWLMVVIVPLMHIVPAVWRWWRTPKVAIKAATA